MLQQKGHYVRIKEEVHEQLQLVCIVAHRQSKEWAVAVLLTASSGVPRSSNYDIVMLDANAIHPSIKSPSSLAGILDTMKSPKEADVSER